MSAHSECGLQENCGAATCPAAAAAEKRARERGQEWSALAFRQSREGLRHYLLGDDGVSCGVHCGDALELQTVETRYDDYGSYDVYLPRGTRVRYEATLFESKLGPQVTLYVSVSGFIFAAALEPRMRFRWPDVIHPVR